MNIIHKKKFIPLTPTLYYSFLFQACSDNKDGGGNFQRMQGCDFKQICIF